MYRELVKMQMKTKKRRRAAPFFREIRPAQKELRRTIANAITKIATVSTIPRTIS